MGTSLTDAESFEVSMFLSKYPRVRPWWPVKCPDDTPPLAKCFVASWCNSLTCCSYLATQFVHTLHLRLVQQVLYVLPEKSKGVKSGDLGGRAIVPPSRNTFAWQLLIEKGFLSLGWEQSYGYHESMSSSKKEPLHIMPTQWKPFSISSCQAKGLGEWVLSHSLPGHQIWPFWISSYWGYI
jgi:hypothetical protein